MKHFSKVCFVLVLFGFLSIRTPELFSAQTGTAKQDDRWNTPEGLDKMGNDLRVLFEDFLNKEAGELRRTTGKGFYNLAGPAIDVFQTADELIVQCDVPGFDKKEVSVELLNNVLIIRGKK
ncbi:MAG: Hsp20/alpha crystallin family protein, partial [Candidatus Omnitrophica bacterium]|nr:Hsp20/alpha crystallin family protein [Candidatus Omnitrophota bacterium]